MFGAEFGFAEVPVSLSFKEKISITFYPKLTCLLRKRHPLYDTKFDNSSLLQVDTWQLATKHSE